MKTKEINLTYLAHDVYPKWRRLVKTAQARITVYTPYLDKVVLILLQSKIGLGCKNVAIITDFNPASILEQPHQLLTIKKALTNGYSVLSLTNLHAKVLLVDDKYVATGSQNFTQRGRKNKECTVVPSEQMNGSLFVKTLISWREQAVPIDEELVDVLLSKLQGKIKQYKKLLKEVEATFDSVCKKHAQQKQKALIERLAELERQSNIRMAQGTVYANIDYVPNDDGGYELLRADHSYDMTKWIVKKTNGSTEPYGLSRLSVYPIILAETNQMGFARIGKTRISYIRSSLSWNDRALALNGVQLNVTISFPKVDTKKRNITIKLSNSYYGGCEFDVLFTGDSMEIVDKRYHKGNDHNAIEYIELHRHLETFFASESELGSFFKNFFKCFTYSELGRDNKNIRDYLDSNRYRLSIIEYQSNPFLVLKKVA
jgi:hypothetical protein